MRGAQHNHPKHDFGEFIRASRPTVLLYALYARVLKHIYTTVVKNILLRTWYSCSLDELKRSENTAPNRMRGAQHIARNMTSEKLIRVSRPTFLCAVCASPNTNIYLLVKNILLRKWYSCSLDELKRSVNIEPKYATPTLAMSPIRSYQ